MKDIKIGNYKINARDELTFKVTIKDGDYTVAERELLKNSEKNGDMLDINITGLVNGDESNNIKKKLNQLAMNMNTYAEKSGTPLEQLTRDLYSKYGVTSRADMAIEDIEREIETFRLGIMEYSN